MRVFEDSIHDSSARRSRLSSPAGAISETLDLSESRTYDAALDITGAYKLTGNFTLDLELVLSDLDVLDKITFDIKPKKPLSDHRSVEFRPADLARLDEHGFRAIIRIVQCRIGADPAQSWWRRLTHSSLSAEPSPPAGAPARRSPS
jgi:hypothetical protein